MNKITLTTILSVVLLGSFFMPFFYWHSFEMNGFNFILSDHIPSYKYILLVIPLTALFYLFGVLSEENYFFSRQLLSWLPLSAILITFLLVFINENRDSRFFDGGNILSNTGSGFWLALGSSWLLTLTRSKAKARYHYLR
jgi:hypothetical protein